MRDDLSDQADVVISADGRRLRPVKSLMRAIDLIEALAGSGRPLGVTELAAATGSSKTAAYNLLTTLELRGLMRRDAQNRFQLGWGLFEWGELVRVSSDLGSAARLQVEDLAEITGETALLGILDQGSVIFLQKAESRRSIRMVQSPGQRLPLHATTAGLILLAFSSAEFRARYLAAPERPADGVMGSEALAGLLERIAADGLAVSYGDPEPDVTSVSVPVFGYDGDVIAALMLAGPSSRLTDDRVVEYRPQMLAAASVISRGMGGRFRS